MNKFRLIIISLLLFLAIETTNAQWASQSSGTNWFLFSVNFNDTLTGCAVGMQGTILKTTDGGQNWYSVNSNTNYQLNSVLFVTPRKVFAVGVGGLILKSTDAGENWSSVPSGTTRDFWSICFTDTLHGYLASNNAILRTIDGGQSWTIQYTSVQYLVSICFPDANTGYAVGSNTKFLKTTNGGDTWEEHPTGVYEFLNSVYFTSPLVGYAVGNTGTIIKTIDGGENWVRYINPYTGTLRSIVFTHENTGYIAGSMSNTGHPGTIFKTIDAGNHWTISCSDSPDFFEAICFSGTQVGYAVGDVGCIWKTSNAGGGSASAIHSNEALYESRIFTYQNPANNELYINGIDNSAELIIYSIEGRNMLHIQNYQGSINIEDWAQGLYLLIIKEKNDLFTTKFLKEY